MDSLRECIRALQIKSGLQKKEQRMKEEHQQRRMK